MIWVLHKFNGVFEGMWFVVVHKARVLFQRFCVFVLGKICLLKPVFVFVFWRHLRRWNSVVWCACLWDWFWQDRRWDRRANGGCCVITAIRDVWECVWVLGADRELAVERDIAAGTSFIANGLFRTGWFEMIAGFFAVFIPDKRIEMIRTAFDR